MNVIEYVRQAIRTKSNKFYPPANTNSGAMALEVFQKHGVLTVDVLHAVMGLSTEAGEALDAAKKSMFYGRPVDYVNLDEEMGDALWYIAIYCHARDIDIMQLMNQNIAKLRARFPEKFTEYDANNRNLAVERDVLEKHTPPFPLG